MTSEDREAIEGAMQRMLAGAPIHSTGELTVVQLAIEAGVKRWRLTHQHEDLRQRFQDAVASRNHESPLLAPLRQKVGDLTEQVRTLRDESSELRATLKTYAEIIDDLHSALIATRAPGSNVTPINRSPTTQPT